MAGVGGGRLDTLMQIQHEAYMLTRSMHSPGTRLPCRLATKPRDSNARMYQGVRALDRSMARPPMRSARFSLAIWLVAAAEPGSNQSMLSMTTATVSDPGARRAMT